ncbi:acyl carrier protein [Streptomyces sp. AJS327]|uniref:acyl carrier protein n=1 Tax=Streptomyces sp. AJS327 TaxID=2545265 RepID=UPI0015DE8CFE|nr:acyl carrier protein [Streptomyces sp. AJS327]MBA0049525.1 acyl carrier protein [Streptomyces sp. AJS327]QTC09980.1 acyl carrier protein [Streptomyces sp.]
MTEGEIRAVVRESALRIFELEPGELADDTAFEAVGGDSIQRLELVSVLQEQLGVVFTVEEEVEIVSVRAAVEYSQRALEK